MNTFDMIKDFTDFRKQLKNNFITALNPKPPSQKGSSLKEKLKTSFQKQSSQKKKEPIPVSYFSTTSFNQPFSKKVSQELTSNYSTNQLVPINVLVTLNEHIENLNEDELKQIPKEYIELLLQLSEFIQQNIK